MDEQLVSDLGRAVSYVFTGSGSGDSFEDPAEVTLVAKSHFEANLTCCDVTGGKEEASLIDAHSILIFNQTTAHALVEGTAQVVWMAVQSTRDRLAIQSFVGMRFDELGGACDKKWQAAGNAFPSNQSDLFVSLKWNACHLHEFLNDRRKPLQALLVQQEIHLIDHRQATHCQRGMKYPG